MAKCEDYPCCGHTAGDPCPDVDKHGRIVPRCCECNKKLARNARSSICVKCIRAANRRYQETGDMVGGLMRIEEPNWYPCYLNPTFDEVLELARSGWDTCRILVNSANGDMVIASGYGNTHTSIANRYRAYTKRKRDGLDPYILYHRNGVALLNLEDMSGHERARVEENLELFAPHEDLIRDLIRESNLSM